METRRLELLQKMPVFGAIREESLRLLLAQARVVEAGAGGYFFCEGDAATTMFVLEAGQAVVVKGWRGREVILNQLVAGDCFGEMALMDLGPRSASVRAVEPCRAMAIGTDDLMRLFENDAEQFALIQMNLGREVCRRLRATDELLFRAKMGDAQQAPNTEFLNDEWSSP